ncbi:hypothetical protein DICPUDRAFT_158138 [Dictyostelium purpureum]|uniref:EKC/KEOPS complex subunit CGI121 n=1 Tax=Dictyostelium purpureum TaxID=5786 RepID=F1A0X5_DICPU|nr:uncharacterized protein DICPUDRAFT_158138 [Dictyostelium purpureum]EGC30158.1 hypothetical protein DICPUDRAFT_158138 [Dictyostelium purpureum]|eukprot:XP_003293320.1 hypothetical protein DICPUDRAFT_158138 [Dictyostelium purpureum]
MKQYPIIIYPDNNITILLFKNVENSKEIKELITNNQMECAIANCKPIYDHQQILIAATRSIGCLLEAKKPNYNINKDIINRLSPSGNYTEAFNNFGLNSDDKEFFVFLFNASEDKIKKIREVIKGEEVDISNNTINPFFDVESAKKLYKITESDLPTNLEQNDEFFEKLKRLIINNMAIKGLL